MLNCFHVLKIKYTNILPSLLYSFGRREHHCVGHHCESLIHIIVYLIWGELLQMHYLKSDIAACFASGWTFWGSLKQRSDRTDFQDSMCSGCFWHKRSSCVFCENIIMLTFVDVVFCLSEIKAESEMGVSVLSLWVTSSWKVKSYMRLLLYKPSIVFTMLVGFFFLFLNLYTLVKEND